MIKSQKSLAVNKKTVVGREKSKRRGVKMTPSGVLVLSR